MANNNLVQISPITQGEPTYEIIKKQDIEGAFKDALIIAMNELLARIDNLIEIMTSSAPQGLWTWGYTSRWDYDFWW